MVRTTRSKLIIFSVLLVTLLGITLLDSSFTFYAVLQSSSANAYGEGYYGEGEYGYGTARPTIALRTPEDASTYTKSSVSFIYNVSSLAISNCSLIIDGAVNGSVDTSITVDTNQTFTRTLYNDTYTWSVNCTDDANRENASDAWTVTVDCLEDWTCTSWSACSGGIQTRTCTDNSECFTNGSKPAESQSCSANGGTAGGGGGGGGGGKTYIPPDLEISEKLIKVELKQGETKSLELKIKNTASTAQSITIELQGLDKLLIISETSFSLEPYEEKTLTLAFTASETESAKVYTGKMIIKSDTTQKTAPVVIEVEERKALFDIKVKLPQEFKTIEQGKEVEVEIIIYNLGDLMPVDVVITYSIKDFDGHIINLRHETLAVEEQKRITRQLLVPGDLKPDSYLFDALLEYEDQKATSSDIFEVVEKTEEKKASFLESLKGHKAMFSIGILILVMVFIIIVYGVKKFRKKPNHVSTWKEQQTIQQVKKEGKKDEENTKFVSEFAKFVRDVENNTEKKRTK